MKKLALLFIGIIVFVATQGAFFYKGCYRAPELKTPGFEQITVPPYHPGEFSDTVAEKKTGKIVIDLAHKNNFTLSELNVLFLRVLNRGFTIELLHDTKEFKDTLSGANALIIVCPKKDFSKDDAKLVDEFVTGGKKLLLIGDPTRASPINSLSLGFGLVFEPDYLYNLKDNEANYRNIFVIKFKDNPITKNLKRIVLYTAGSISPPDLGIAFPDENTFSSLSQVRRELSPIALAKDDKVLAVYDLTFIIEPWNTVADNNQLISNIADWLTSKE